MESGTTREIVVGCDRVWTDSATLKFSAAGISVCFHLVRRSQEREAGCTLDAFREAWRDFLSDNSANRQLRIGDTEVGEGVVYCPPRYRDDVQRAPGAVILARDSEFSIMLTKEDAGRVERFLRSAYEESYADLAPACEVRFGL